MKTLQSDFVAAGCGPTQCALILRRLQLTPNQWVTLPEIYEVSGSMAVAVRVSDLRKHGHIIECRVERAHNSRQLHSYYRLVAGQERAKRDEGRETSAAPAPGHN